MGFLKNCHFLLITLAIHSLLLSLNVNSKLISLAPFKNGDSVIKISFFTKEDKTPTPHKDKKRGQNKIINKSKNRIINRVSTGVTTKAISVGTITPEYPIISRRLGEEGLVTVFVKIGANGKTLETQIIKSSGVERLDLSAIKALLEATFSPAKRGGIPIESSSKFTFNFKLN